MGVYHSAPLTYPAGQFPTFLTGSGSAIAAIVEARRMRTPPSDGAILEHFRWPSQRSGIHPITMGRER